MSKIGIFVNPEKDPGLVYLKQVIFQLEKIGFTYDVSSSGSIGNDELSFVSPAECFADADLILTLGGDGTLLKAAIFAHQGNIPLLGINLGHLGFLAELEPEEIPTLPAILSNGFECTQRMMLTVGIIRDSKCIKETVALNDAVIRSRIGKPSQIVLSDADNDLLDYFCDGFIIATPTGSTAYSMSAGGPILEPRSDGIVVTPICPHTLGSRSVVFGAAQQAIYIRVTNADKINSLLECDGAKVCELHAGDIVRISRHEIPLHLVKLSNKSFYKVLNDKISRRML